MLHKLSAVMGKRDSRYQPDQIIELDEGLFRAPNTDASEEEKNEDQKRGRGSQSQTKVLVMESSKVSMDKSKNLDKYSKSTQLKYIKMLMIDDLKGSTISEKVKANISHDSVVKSDDFRSYSKINELAWRLYPVKTPKDELEKALPWVHTMISNAKRNFLGINHMTSKKHIQNYLNEFCYKN